MKIKRYFTEEWRKNNPGASIYDMFKWKKVDVIIKDYNSGDVLFSGKDLEFPEHYSQTACDIIAKMYFRKSGVPNTDHEVSLYQVVRRMVNFWCHSAKIEGLITDEEFDILYDELSYTLLNQMWAPNSPQWFNTGLYLEYGIKGESNGLCYYSPQKGEVVECEDAYSRTQASACFIVGIEDSLIGDQSLMDNLTTASRLFKYGSGIGSNWSKVRGIGERLSSGGKSSGLLSFQKVFDRNAGAIKSGGTTRRAAVMEVLDLDHPEIEEFVKWKSHEEDKVVALGKMGYNTSINGEAYETVSGQNVNNSVSVPNSFMRKVIGEDNDDNWTLKGRQDNSVDKDISAKKLWDDIAYGAWRCGDPGLQFTDTINEWNTCPNSGRINASNPCGEYLFLDDTACNLASINIAKLYDINKESFDFDGYLQLITIIQYVLEASIYWGAFPTKHIARNTHLYRTTGLGLTNIGTLIMSLAIPYDSVQARSIIAELCNIMTAQSYYTSTQMAKKVGPFPAFKINQDEMLNVIDKHRRANPTELSVVNSIVSKNTLTSFFSKEQLESVKQLWRDTIENGIKYGFRNAQVTVLAPTGTIAFAMDCDSTSIEPFFSHKVYKKVVDGSYIEMINNVIPIALDRLGYNEDEINDIVKYIMNGDGKIEGAPHLKESDLPVFDTANRCGSGKRYLSPEAHVKMVAAVSQSISGGISKTINMPSTATPEDIKRIYELAWELGCKGITVYRDGCKSAQPLNTTKDEVSDADTLENMSYDELVKFTKDLIEERNSLTQTMLSMKANPETFGISSENIKGCLVREKLPYEPKCIKNAVKMDGDTYHITRSFYDDGRLGEIFVSVGKQGNTVKGLSEVLCILISKCLQYGIPAEIISEIMRNAEFSPNGMVRQHDNIKAASSIPDLISKFIDISTGDYTYCQVKPDRAEVKEGLSIEIIGVNHASDYVDSANARVATIMNKSYVNESADKNDTHIKGEKVYGKTCHECGSTHIVKAGTCYYCQDCGSSSGCS